MYRLTDRGEKLLETVIDSSLKVMLSDPGYNKRSSLSDDWVDKWDILVSIKDTGRILPYADQVGWIKHLTRYGFIEEV